MTLNFSAKITVDAKERTKAIFDSINTDNDFYPENPTKTIMSFGDDEDEDGCGVISIDIASEQIPHLRANLNSTLRLVQASHDAIESVKI